MNAKIDEHFENKCNWMIWRSICDRIISNPHYRYNGPKKFALLNMAHFACDQMGIYNTRAWGGSSRFLPGDFARFARRRGRGDCPVCGNPISIECDNHDFVN